MRHNYKESCKLLQKLGHLPGGRIPPLPSKMPAYDDAKPGVSFFRTFVGEGNLKNLTIPRTFFGRSQVGQVSFANSDLSESVLCWNDFTEVDFSDCDLSRTDLRASEFNRVIFTRADLTNADLRLSNFRACNFVAARMRGTRLTKAQGRKLKLSKQQRQEIDWQNDEGEEPPGG